MSRSQSRGRETYFSSGRGGAGNMRPASREPAVRGKGPDDFSPTRGRELPSIGDSITHTGRGGAANVRSPSKDAAGERAYAAEVNQYVKDHTNPEAPVSSGRGGYGNIDRSRSRSREPAVSRERTNVHTYGHGGAGNVISGTPAHLGAVEEDEAKAYRHSGGVHSTGRGGAANITDQNTSYKADVTEAAEHHKAPVIHSSGRGGYGNMS
ncbi:hypothetical protein FRC16_007639 [Serendipita sp. 398]|nr:hypothetical protein FRC16_007639 [Serendipita sp. 398]